MNRLQNLSYKTLLTILFFSLAGIVFFLKIGGKTTKVSAAWWDDAWHYRKAISVTNSSGSNLTDFQVSISIGTSQLIADGKMQTDCDDIRITDINSNVLPYWIEENNPGCNQLTDTKVWLKANSLPTSGATVYVYYGNPSAANSENGNNVFEFFDDFKTYTGWIGDTGNFTNTTDGNRTVIKVNNNNAPGEIFKTMNVPNNYIVEIAIKDSDESSNAPHPGLIFASNGTTSNYNGFYIRSQSDQIVGSRNGGYGSPESSLTIDTNWHTYKTTIVGSTLVSLIFDNSTQVSVFDNLSITNSKSHIGLWSHDTQANGFYDNLFIRKYASTQPTSTPQSEETGTGPIAYWKFDEGVGTTAYDSAGNNNAILGLGNSSPDWTSESQCISGKCLYFDGTNNDYIEFNAPIPSNSSFTISMWYYPTRTNPSYDQLYSGTDNIDLQLFFNTSTKQINTSIENNEKAANFTLSASNINKWYHIEWTYDKSRRKVFLNGSLIADDSDTTTFTRNDTRARIGSLLNSSLYKLQGYIDEVKIYTYARSINQVKLDYNSRGSIKGASANLGIKSNTAPSIKSSLVAHYKFDEGNGTSVYDSSGNNRTGYFGTGNSAPVWSNEGKYNKSLNFNNTNSQVTVSGSNFSSLVGTAQFTASAWIKSNDVSQNQTIFSANPPFFLRIRSNHFRVGIYTISGWTFVDGNINLVNNKWHHLVLTYDGSNMKSYVDGILDTNTSKTGTFSGFSTVCVGYPVATGEQYLFNGLIDEVKIYNRALTADEVKQDYNAGSAIQFGTSNQTIGGTTTSLQYCIPGDTSYCAAPVAEWNFEENTGTTTKDTSGNNNNGIFGTGNSAPTWTIGANNKGAGVNFDGSNDYVSINDTSILKPTSAITVETWFNPSNKTLTSQRIVSKTEGSGYQLSLNETSVCGSTNLCFTINFGGTYYTATYPASNLSNNVWYHATGIYDGNTVKLFLNGSNVGTTSTISGNINQSTPPLCIGSEPSSTSCNAQGGNFSGKIDGVKIYNYARTPAQVAYDYNRGAPVGWWKLDECQGSTAFDASGLGNTGAISIGLSGSQTSLGTCQTGTSAAWTNGSSGHTNSSLNFDGSDDKVTINDLGSNSSLDANGKNITLSAWINGSSFNSGYKGIIVKQSAAPYEMWVYDDDFICGFKIDNVSQRNTYISNFLTNTWYHLVCSYDGTNIKAYINGSLKQSWIQAGSVITDNNSPVYLGWSGYSTEYFNGKLDDVRIYNYALTSEQVKQVYNGGSINFQ